VYSPWAIPNDPRIALANMDALTGYPHKETTAFIKIGVRIRKIGLSKYRYESWATDKWLQEGVIGTVTEYHPENPPVRINGELFEATPPYAVVQWDLAPNALTCINPEDEGISWERIK